MGEEERPTLKPVYRFDWNDGSSRLTSELVNKSVLFEEGVELLAELGRADDECTVTLVGYES